MSTIVILAFMGPISWFWHPHVYEHGVCKARPGTYAALFCPVISVEKPGPYKTTWGFRK